MIVLPNIFRTIATWRALLMGMVAVALLLAPMVTDLAEERTHASLQIGVGADDSGVSDPLTKAIAHCGHCSHYQATRAERTEVLYRATYLAAYVRFWNDPRVDDAGASPLPKPPRA